MYLIISDIKIPCKKVGREETYREYHQEERSEMIKHLGKEIPPKTWIWREVGKRGTKFKSS